MLELKQSELNRLHGLKPGRIPRISYHQFIVGKKMIDDGEKDWYIEHVTGLTTYRQNKLKRGDYDELFIELKG